MKFSDRILSRTESGKNPLPRLKNWIAESQSLHSAMPRLGKSWLPHYRSAREAEIILFLGLFLHEWEVWEVTQRIVESCYFHRYSGAWEQVQKILEQVLNLQEYEEKYSMFYNDDEFFGNLLRDAEKFLKRNPHSFKDLVRDEKRPRRLIRHRGYRDKGSLRPYHQRGRNLPDPEPGQDRRGKVRYGNLPDI
jgi:hypothetical protein